MIFSKIRGVQFGKSNTVITPNFPVDMSIRKSVIKKTNDMKYATIGLMVQLEFKQIPPINVVPTPLFFLNNHQGEIIQRRFEGGKGAGFADNFTDQIFCCQLFVM